MAQAESRPAIAAAGEDPPENKELSLLFVGLIFPGGSGWLFYQRTAPLGGSPLLHDFCVVLVILLLILAVLLSIKLAIPGRKILGCSVPYIHDVILVVACVLFVAQLSDQPPFVSFLLFSFMFVVMLLAILAIPRLFRWRGFVIKIEHLRDHGEPSPQQEREGSDPKSTPPKEPEKDSELKGQEYYTDSVGKGEEKEMSVSSASAEKIEVTKMPKLIDPLMFPIIKLSKENYLSWKAHVTAILQLHHLLPHVVEPHTKDEEDSDEWVKYDRHVMDVLLGSVTESVMLKFAGAQSAKEIWDRVAIDFASSSEARIQELLGKLHTLNKGSQSLDDYIKNLRSIYNSLTAFGERVDQRTLVRALLQGLGPQYADVIVYLRMRPTLPTFEEVVAYLCDHEAMLRRHQNGQVVNQLQFMPIANQASVGTSRNDNSPQNFGSWRGLLGEGQPSNNSNSRAPKYPNFEGNWRRSLQCYAQNATNLATSSHWYPHRSATHHVAYHLNALIYLQAYATGQQFLIGDGTGGASHTSSGGSLLAMPPTQ